jgi:hypothetical protein
LSHRYLYFVFAAGLALMVAGCKKDNENSAVIEEVPSAAPPVETDTSATLSEEPSLKQVGKDKPGSAKNTFHPSGKGAGASSAAASDAGFSESGHFVVQVAIFKSRRQAGALVEKLSGEGYPAYVAEVENPVPELSGTYHRVRIGKFARIADARSFGENTLKPLGYDFWVDNKKNDGMGGTGGEYSAPASEPAAPAYETPAAEAPAPKKAKKSKAVAVEPETPPNGTWGAPQAEEPASKTTDSWSAPAASEAPAAKAAAAGSELPGTQTSPDAAKPAEPAKADTGKVNLDEW